jgi:hypothetical protein
MQVSSVKKQQTTSITVNPLSVLSMEKGEEKEQHNYKQVRCLL